MRWIGNNNLRRMHRNRNSIRSRRGLRLPNTTRQLLRQLHSQHRRHGLPKPMRRVRLQLRRLQPTQRRELPVRKWHMLDLPERNIRCQRWDSMHRHGRAIRLREQMPQALILRISSTRLHHWQRDYRCRWRRRTNWHSERDWHQRRKRGR